MNLTTTFLFLLICTLYTHAQEDLSSAQRENRDHFIDNLSTVTAAKGPSFEFVLRVDTIHRYNEYSQDSMHYFNIHAVEIYNAGVQSYNRNSPAFLQRFHISVEGLELWRYTDIPARLVDVNFDGYEDFEVLYFPGMYWNNYQYYIYDPDHQNFKEDTALVQLTDPTFHADQKYVHYSWHIGVNEFGHAVYQWQGDTLVILGKEVQSYLPGPNGDEWDCYSAKWINGERKEMDCPDNTPEGPIYGLGPCSMHTHMD